VAALGSGVDLLGPFVDGDAILDGIVVLGLEADLASVRRWPAVALRACDEMAIALSRPHPLQTGR
jgi:hypothetical protein